MLAVPLMISISANMYSCTVVASLLFVSIYCHMLKYNLHMLHKSPKWFLLQVSTENTIMFFSWITIALSIAHHGISISMKLLM